MPQPKSSSAELESSDPRPTLSLFYAAKFGHLGIVLPFLAPWLATREWSPAAIGVLLALPPLFKVTAPWTWARWADLSGRRRGLTAVAAVSAAVALTALTGPAGGAWTIGWMAFYGFARAPILPYLEATSLEQVERRRFAYGPIRLWGSIAFVVCSTGCGLLAERVPLEAGLRFAAALLAVCGGLALLLPRPDPRADRPAPTSRTAARDPSRRGLIRLLAACALMQVSHGAYYTFYSIRLQDLGYGAGIVGGLWALAVVAEVVLLTRMDRIVERFGHGRVLRVCLVLAAVRWALIGFVASLPWLVVGQLLHAATYAAFHVAAIRVVHRAFGPGRRAVGQATYSGMTFGLGMFVGSLVAGALAAPLGLPWLFRLSALVPLLAWVVLGRLRPAAPLSGTAPSTGSAR